MGQMVGNDSIAVVLRRPIRDEIGGKMYKNNKSIM